MKFIERIRLALKAFGGFTNSGGSNVFGFAGAGSGPRQYVESNVLNGYAGWAYAAISKRAKRVGKMSWHLYEYRGEDVKEIFDSEVLALLYRPNKMQTRYEFLYTLEMFLCIWGKAPVYVEKNQKGKVISLWPLRPDCLKKDKEKGVYTYRVGQQQTQYELNDVFIIREPSPQSLEAGASALQAASLEIDTDVAAAIWNRSLLENSAESGVMLETDKVLDDKQYRRIKEQWNQRQAGPTNAGKTAILENGLKANAVGKSPKDMSLDETRRFNRGAIVSILGVPEPLLTSENSNLANVEGSERIFNVDTIDPEMRLINDAFNEFFVILFDSYLYLDYDSPVQDDVQQKINIATAGEGRWLTVNEARAIFNYEPVENGDEIYKPLGVAPISMDFSDPAIPATDPATEPAKMMRLYAKHKALHEAKIGRIKQYIMARTHTERVFSTGVIERVTKRLAEISDKKALVLKIKAGPKKKDQAEEELGEDYDPDLDPRLKAERIEFVKALPKYQKRYQRKLQSYFGDLEAEVLANLEEEGLPKSRFAQSKANTNWVRKILFDKKKAEVGLLTISAPVWVENITRGANNVGKLLGKKPVDKFTTPFVIQFIQEREIKLKAVTDTTEAALRAALTEGITNGENTGQIRERIEDVFGMAQGFRSETIARTEVSTSQNFGRLEEMRVSKVKNKKWMAIFSNTREAHQEAHGQVVGVDEAFSVGGEDLMYPGDQSGSPENVINCQCSASPTLDDIN